MAENTLK